jgi:hypothetical protein
MTKKRKAAEKMNKNLLAPAAEHIGYASELWDENFPCVS